MQISRDGWCSLAPPLGLDGLHVRVARAEDGRLLITDLYVHGAEITAEAVRGISISRLEAALNDPAISGTLEGVGLRSWAQGGKGHWPDDELTLPALRQRASTVESRQQRRLVKLSRPTGRDSDSFYRDVASAYAELARATRAPAKVLAEEAEVPITTVHRWVREARRRGFLPPGRKGKAG